MSAVIVQAASYLTPDGYGSHTLGRRPWLDAQGRTYTGRAVMDISWSSLFKEPCPRFGRMSPLARLGLMAVELLDAGFATMTERQRTNTGICLLSPSGSLITDVEFLRDLSPATFTYTLPSSVIGEVCIRHRLRGPGLCLMSDEQAGRSLITEATERLVTGEADGMLCLVCEAGGPEVKALTNNVLDRAEDFCWYAYALFLTRQDASATPGQGTVPDGADMARLCLATCDRS